MTSTPVTLTRSASGGGAFGGVDATWSHIADVKISDALKSNILLSM